MHIEREQKEIKKSKTMNFFCSSSCAAKYNNKLFPKRKRKITYCAICSKELIDNRNKFCGPCLKNKEVVNFTYEEVAGKRKYQKHSRIRQHARKVYLQSDLPKQCIICGYSKHFDICHINSIGEFQKETLIKEINSISNLIALCRNHHWELDHSLLGEEEMKIINKHLEERIVP